MTRPSDQLKIHQPSTIHQPNQHSSLYSSNGCGGNLNWIIYFLDLNGFTDIEAEMQGSLS